MHTTVLVPARPPGLEACGLEGALLHPSEATTIRLVSNRGVLMALQVAVSYMANASSQYIVVACLNSSQSSEVCSSKPHHWSLAGELQDERAQPTHQLQVQEFLQVALHIVKCMQTWHCRENQHCQC